MSKKIHIDLNSNRSIDHAIAELNRLQKQIEQFPAYLADKEYGTAQTAYNLGADINDDPVVVSVEAQKDKATIRATGNSVVFLEYGAGVGTEAVDTTVYGGEYIPTGQGTYSQIEGQGRIPYSGDGFWFFNHKYYKTVEATRGMRTTAENTRRDANMWAEEYFK